MYSITLLFNFNLLENSEKLTPREKCPNTRLFLARIFLYSDWIQKCPNTELFLVRIFLYSDWIRRDTPYLSVFSQNAGKYGTILWTGITCKKIPCCMHHLDCRWLILENVRIFHQSYVKHFWIFPRERNCRILIGLCK